MRRIDLENGLRQVREALESSALRVALREYRALAKQEVSPNLTTKLLTALKSYAISANGFSPAANQVTEILGLESLLDPTTWALLVTPRDSVQREFTHDVLTLHSLIGNALEVIPRMFDLLVRELPRGVSIGDDQGQSKILSVSIVEGENLLSTPDRLIAVLAGVQGFYEVCSIMTEPNAQPLSVLSLDSGSDKSFDFLGAAKVIECVKDLTIALWDRIVFFKERQQAERIQLVADALPVIQQIGDLEQQNKMSREQAEILRRKVFSSTEKFISSGAMIPEMEIHAYNEPRLLLAPEPKLLAAPQIETVEGTVVEPENSTPRKPKGGKKRTSSSSAAKAANDEMPDLSSLSSEEMATLSALMKKTQKRKSTRSAKPSKPEAESPDPDSDVEID